MNKKRKLSSSVYNNAYENKDKGGSSRQGCIDWKKCAGEKELKFYKPREGVNKINIIPFEVKSKLNPMVKGGKLEIGDLDFMLDIFVHRQVGINNADILCPKKNYGRSCPICEKSAEYYEKGNKEEAKALTASRRALINVQPIIRGEAEPLQIFEVSHYLFMNELLEEANECKDGENIIPFADIEKGKVIKFRGAETTLNKNTFLKFKSFDFIEREEELDDELIDKAISFDEGLILLSYEEIEKIMYGVENDDGEEDEKPVKKKEKKVDAEEEDEEPIKQSKKIDIDDDEEEEEDEVEKKPTKEEKSKEKEDKCPYGHKWGEADEHKECKKCDVWDDCIDSEK